MIVNLYYYIIVIDTKNRIINQISEECKNFYIKKLEVSNLISSKYNKNDKKYELNDNKSFLKDLNSYLPSFLKYLWESPIFVSKLLINSDISDVKNILAPFFMNNFYTNILSSNYIEDNLMYVLTLLLKNEINNLKSINDCENFLDDNSHCKYLLNELKGRNDVQEFFKFIIYDAVENLEIKYSGKKIDFNINQKILHLKNKQKRIRDEDLRVTDCDIDDFVLISDINKTKYIFDKNEFVKKYLQNLSKDYLEKKLEENKNNKNMIEYINFQIKKIQNDEEIFSRNHLMEAIFYADSEEFIPILYENDFRKVIEIIDKILDNIKKNLYFIPYSLKCFCKIISVLITRKFPNISITEKNSFVAKFFFKLIFSSIFKNPSIKVLINEFIISGNTLNNLNIISEIINQLVSGKFYTNKFFIPFNYYFLDKMPMIYDLFEQIKDVTLSPFIEKIIDDTLEENYIYNYFDENKGELMIHRSICYNLDEISSLINNMNKNRKILFANKKYINLEKTLDKLAKKNNMELIESLKNHDDYEIIREVKNPKSKKIEYVDVKKRKKLYFFLDTELIFNDTYKNLFEMKQKNENFKLNELNSILNEEDISKNNIIKVKNYLSTILCNYYQIKETNFSMQKPLNTTEILKQLKIFIGSSNFVIDGSIPSEWCGNALLEYITKIPDSYIQNDYEKLYSEFEDDIRNSIKEIDFEALSVCIDKMKLIQRGKNLFEKAKTLILDIIQNETVKQIIEKEIIPVDIKFSYTDAEKYFSINKSKINKLKILDEMVYEEKGILINCPTIESFAEEFPKINQFESSDPFNIMKQLKIPEYLLEYFKIIEIYLLKSQKNLKEDEIKNISNKIYDYVMNNLHKKLFPKRPESKDLRIYNNCVSLSWTEPKHFIKGKINYVYDTFLPDAMKYFKLIQLEKSPRKKIINLSKIFQSINNFEKFNGCDGRLGVDESIAILNYAFIKSKPFQIYNTCRYIELFIGSKNDKLEGNLLAQLKAINNFVLNITYKDLNDVTEEEYNNKSNQYKKLEVSSY